VNLSNYMENKLADFRFRGVAFTPATTIYVALFRATAGQSPRSTAVTLGQTTIPATPNGHMYRCSTAGTTGSGEPTWPTTNGGTVTDGTAVWTEMYTDFETNSAALTATEVSGNAYARGSLACSTTNWAATDGAGSTANPSAGTGGTTSNNVAIAFPTATPGNWGTIAAVGLCDAATVGNLTDWGVLTTPQVVNAGGTFSFGTSALSDQIDN